MFKRKSEKEKHISKLESKIFRYKQKRDFYMPRMKKRLFSNEYVQEPISTERTKWITEYDKKIEAIEQELLDLKNG